MANYSFSTKTNKAASQSKSSSIPASTAEKEHKTAKTRWRKADARLRRCADLQQPKGLQNQVRFQISFNPKHAQDVVAYRSLCSLQQTNL